MIKYNYVNMSSFIASKSQVAVHRDSSPSSFSNTNGRKKLLQQLRLNTLIQVFTLNLLLDIFGGF